MKRIGLFATGVALVAAFFLWIYLRHASEMSELFAASGVASFLGWGLAWLSLLGGCALLARAIFVKPDVDET